MITHFSAAKLELVRNNRHIRRYFDYGGWFRGYYIRRYFDYGRWFRGYCSRVVRLLPVLEPEK